MIFRPTIYRWIWVLLGIFIIPLRAEAFIPQGSHLLEIMTQKIKQPTGLVVYQTRKIIHSNHLETEDIRIEEKLIYSFPGRFRSDVITGPSESIFIESNGRVIRIQDQVTAGNEKTLLDRYIDILLYRDRKELSRHLQMAGMNMETVTMKRYNDTIVFVLGTPPEDGRISTSLWIDQDTFFPVRYILNQNHLQVDICYDNWEIISRTWYPMQIRIFLNQQLFSIILASEVALESQLSDGVFDIDGLAGIYPLAPTQSGDDSENIETLEDNIEAFKKLYE